MMAFVEAPPLFVTLAAGFVIYGAAFWFAPAWVVYAPKDAPAFLFLGAGHVLGIPMPIIVFAVMAIAIHLILSRTSIGRFIYAQGDNPEAARLSGSCVAPPHDPRICARGISCLGRGNGVDRHHRQHANGNCAGNDDL